MPARALPRRAGGWRRRPAAGCRNDHRAGRVAAREITPAVRRRRLCPLIGRALPRTHVISRPRRDAAPARGRPAPHQQTRPPPHQPSPPGRPRRSRCAGTGQGVGRGHPRLPGTSGALPRVVTPGPVARGTTRTTSSASSWSRTRPRASRSTSSCAPTPQQAPPTSPPTTAAVGRSSGSLVTRRSRSGPRAPVLERHRP